jgi:hypothetical protein
MKNLIYPCKIPKLKSERRVGFELEYSNLSIESCANIIAIKYGGDIEKINPYHYKIYTYLGTFKVILDFEFLFESKLKALNIQVGMILDDSMIEKIEELIAQIGKSLIPNELTTPPIPFKNIDEIQTIKELLRKNGAKGTRANLLYAFGFHINPEVLEIKVERIVNDLRAFFVLYDYIKDWLDIDITRRLTTYIDPFDSAYMIKILDFKYQPNIDEFIDDYITYNPTRNRALDLLPLLTFIDENRVRARLPNEKIGKRATYHYRLPDSRVDEVRWSPCFAWNSWVLIERLSSSENELKYLSSLMCEYLQTPWNLIQKDKFEMEVDKWVKESSKLL